MNFRKQLAIKSGVIYTLAPVVAASIGTLLTGTALCQPSTPGVYTIVTIPLSPGNDATGINAPREIIGNYADPDDHGRGYSLRGGSATTINYPGASETAVFGTNSF